VEQSVYAPSPFQSSSDLLPSTKSHYPSIAALSINPGIDVMGQLQTSSRDGNFGGLSPELAAPPRPVALMLEHLY
jgi:hypothetical protein